MRTRALPHARAATVDVLPPNKRMTFGLAGLNPCVSDMLFGQLIMFVWIFFPNLRKSVDEKMCPNKTKNRI